MGTHALTRASFAKQPIYIGRWRERERRIMSELFAGLSQVLLRQRLARCCVRAGRKRGRRESPDLSWACVCVCGAEEEKKGGER